MFIRIKTRKNSQGISSSYAYLVSSRYRKKGVKQKISKYLGKVHSFERVKNVSLQEYLKEDPTAYINKKPLKTSFASLLRHELENHNFIKLSGNRLINSNILVNLSTREAKDIATGKPICLSLNDGFLADYTLSRLLNFKAPEALDKEIGKEMAKRLIGAGILLDEQIFVLLFQKLQKELSTA